MEERQAKITKFGTVMDAGVLKWQMRVAWREGPVIVRKTVVATWRDAEHIIRRIMKWTCEDKVLSRCVGRWIRVKVELTTEKKIEFHPKDVRSVKLLQVGSMTEDVFYDVTKNALEEGKDGT